MFKPSLEEIKDVMTEKSYVCVGQELPYYLNIIGIRSAHSLKDKFCDSIAVIYYDEKEKPFIKYFPATTVPGMYYLENPMDREGTAIMCEGQYHGAYQIGLHHGEYEALVQTGPVKFARDNNRDSNADMVQKQYFYKVIKANIHRANADGTSTIVGKWSAGCQVIQSDFDEFMKLCELHRKYNGNAFDYTLINEMDF